MFLTVKLDAKDKIRCHMNDDMECQDKFWHIFTTQSDSGEYYS